MTSSCCLRTVYSLSECCSHLKHLDLHMCRSISNRSCRYLRYDGTSRFVVMVTMYIVYSTGCKHLEHLDVSNCPRITADGIRALSVGCKCLRTLILEYCQEINDIALETIATHCAGLLRLNIRHCSVSV